MALQGQRGSIGTNVSLRGEISVRRLVPAAATGLVTGVIEVVLATSFAALVFSGALGAHVPAGIGLMLVAAIVMLLTTALFASQPGTVGSIQDVSVAVLALVASGVAARVGSAGDRAFLTVVLALGVTSLLGGLLFFVLGAFRLGDLVRFVPYPVVGGFLAGTGWLLVKGATGLLAGVPLSVSGLSELLRPGVVVRWAPGAVLAVALLLLTRKVRHYLLLPGTLVGAVAVFHIVLLATGTSLREAQSGGWLLGPFPVGTLWRPWWFTSLTEGDWGAVLGEAGNIATLFVIAPLALLLNASGIELILGRDADLNRELRVAGTANVVVGAAGGLMGFHALSLTALAARAGEATRLTGVFAAAVCGIVLLAGASVVSLLPRFVLGGMVLLIGLAFLVEWVYDGWFRLARADYVVVMLILLIVGLAGFLPGVAAGLALAVVLFVVSYSRTDVVRHTLSAATYASNVERPPEHRDVLRRQGERVHVMLLQGFVFFGTAKTLLDRIAARSDADPPLRALVLDFGRVTGLDSSAVLSFARALKIAETKGFDVVLTSVQEEMRARLARAGITEDRQPSLRLLPDLDRGMQLCEERLLEAEGEAAETGHRDLWRQLREALGVDPARLRPYLRREELAEGGHLFRQGDPPGDLFFVETGVLAAEVDRDREGAARLRAMGPGAVVGELPLYLGTPRSASVVADRNSVVWRLALDGFREMERADPDLAAALHRLFATLLARRLSDSARTVGALLG